MIYTSYFSNWRKWPKHCLPIGIVRFAPQKWKYPNCVNLSPSHELRRAWQFKNIDEDMFKLRYLAELQDRGLTPQGVRVILEDIANGKDIVLCCYEKSEDFCHRHILAEWLGDDVKEINGDGEII